jgi:ATP-dependent exoDNAse (exonuclease V) alpha subunit
MYGAEFSADQAEAMEEIENGPGPFFLTGPAGTGKSFIVNHLRQWPDCAVTATTGMAAQLIKGRTVHSFCSIHPVHGVVQSNAANERAMNCNLLIVDEISMASAKLLAQIFARFNLINHMPKFVAVGDFLQLPPVEGKFAFESEFWPDFSIIRLTTMHRQEDADFLKALGHLRVGNVSEEVKGLVEERRVDELPRDCTNLFAHKARVEDMNRIRLDELPGRRYRSQWKVGRVEVYDEEDELYFKEFGAKKEKKKHKFDDRLPRFPKELLLKVDARIIMLTNDKGGRWVNGSSGHVVAVEPGCVSVLLDSGIEVDVSKEDEEIHNADGKLIFLVRQYPMQLAWALTVHKAQGMSIDRIGVDLNAHFAPGMTYVAMSRCRSKEGLFLTGEMAKIKIEPKALDICGDHDE